MKTKVLERCPGSGTPSWDHGIFNQRFNPDGPQQLRKCHYCDKLVKSANGKLRSHGHFLSTRPNAQ
jgi:hypothetical protein